MMAELEGPKSMTTAEFNMHKQRLDHMRQQQQQQQQQQPSVHQQQQQQQQQPRHGSMPDDMGGGVSRSGSGSIGGGHENSMGPPRMQMQHHSDMLDDQAYQFRSVQITRDQMMSAMGPTRNNSWDGRRDNDFSSSSWGRPDDDRTRLDVNSPKNGMGWGDGGGGMPYAGSGGGGGGGMSSFRYGDPIGEQAGGSSHFGMCSPGGGEMSRGYNNDCSMGGFGGVQAGSSMDNLDNMQNDWSNEQVSFAPTLLSPSYMSLRWQRGAAPPCLDQLCNHPKLRSCLPVENSFGYDPTREWAISNDANTCIAGRFPDASNKGLLYHPPIRACSPSH